MKIKKKKQAGATHGLLAAVVTAGICLLCGVLLRLGPFLGRVARD